MTEVSIDNYFDCDKIDLSVEGIPNYILTKDGRIWSNNYHGDTFGWVKPSAEGFSSYNLSVGSKIVTISVDKLVAKYFVAPTMLSMPDTYKRYENTPLIVSKYGIVFDESSGKFRTPSRGGKYLHVTTGGKYYNIHRLVAKLFVPNPDPDNLNVVNRINFNRWDNRAENLEWTDAYGNVHASLDAGRMRTDGSLSKSEKSMYPKKGYRSHKLPRITDLLVHVAGPNWTIPDMSVRDVS